jgi:hypothetical protein
MWRELYSLAMVRFVLAGVVTLALVSDARASEEESRILYGGEITFNYAPKDPGYFNETEYTHDALRLVRLSFDLELRAAESFAVLTEIRSDNLGVPEPYALYVRLRPVRDRAFDIQVGRIPPVFGSYSRRRYDSDNPLIGYPLPYQYPTSLRADSAPATVDRLLMYRGYGARTRYAIGNTTVKEGLAQVNPLRWDTGVQVRLGSDPIELAVAVTQGTISSPLVEDDNGGKQIAGRVGFRPAFGVELGFSGARGDYVAEVVTTKLPNEGRGDEHQTHQTSFGADAEIGRGPWLFRGEAIWTRWDVPTLPSLGSLDALGFFVEGRYKITAGLYAAARISGSRFSSVDRPEVSGGDVTWDAPVTRLEAGIGYNLHRHLLLKVVLQLNERDGGPTTSRTTPAVQALFWF